MITHLDWGVKSTWRRYVLGLSDGSFQVEDGVQLESQSARFPVSDASAWTGVEGTLKFSGTLQASGHFGMPLGHVIDPWIEYEGGKGQLTTVRWPRRGQRIPLADLEGDLSSGPVEATLTLEGSEVFGGVYSAGAELDALHLVEDDS